MIFVLLHIIVTVKALDLDGAALDKAWGAAKDAGQIIKLGGGFYCGRLGEGDSQLYTFNVRRVECHYCFVLALCPFSVQAFYMSMRDRFTAPGGAFSRLLPRARPMTSDDNPTLSCPKWLL